MSVRDWKGTAKMTVKKLSEIIGTTGDTGGTATAGTLMAKVNAMLKGQGTQAAESTSQEILEKVKGNNVSGEILMTKLTKQNHTSNIANKVVFSLEGKGKLLWVNLHNQMGASSGSLTEETKNELKIIIDGEVVHNFVVKSTATSSRIYLSQVLSDVQFLKMHSGNLYTPDFQNGLSDVDGSTALSPTKGTYTDNTSTTNVFAPIEKWLQFDNSVEIVISASSKKTFDSSTYYNFAVGYMLDE